MHDACPALWLQVSDPVISVQHNDFMMVYCRHSKLKDPLSQYLLRMYQTLKMRTLSSVGCHTLKHHLIEILFLKLLRRRS